MRIKAISQQRKRFLLALPLVAAPFICFVFYSLGGGGGSKDIAHRVGLNLELPKARFDLKDAMQNKLGFYHKAEQDSIKKKTLERLDPFKKDSTILVRRGMPANDRRAEDLLHQLGKLRESLHAQDRPTTVTPGAMIEWPARPVRPTQPDTGVRDPQMERLNTLLD